jgi:hypothetical protein
MAAFRNPRALMADFTQGFRGGTWIWSRAGTRRMAVTRTRFKL